MAQLTLKDLAARMDALEASQQAALASTLTAALAKDPGPCAPTEFDPRSDPYIRKWAVELAVAANNAVTARAVDRALLYRQADSIIRYCYADAINAIEARRAEDILTVDETIGNPPEVPAISEAEAERLRAQAARFAGDAHGLA